MGQQGILSRQDGIQLLFEAQCFHWTHWNRMESSCSYQ